jgi:RNA polymerase sigma-70 factor (ECF subfamily)
MASRIEPALHAHPQPRTEEAKYDHPAPRRDHPTLSDEEVQGELSRALPNLRAFARGLCGNADMADDLTQDALLKAWAARKNYEAGTNFRAWIFTILRNCYLSQMRRSRFRGKWDEKVAEKVLVTNPSQDSHLQLSDVWRATQQLPEPQREALILIGAEGFSYEEAARVCGVPIGTVKSRVARARNQLQRIIA